MVIQIASLTGTYGLSFLIVLVNAALATLFIGRLKSPLPYRGSLLIITASFIIFTLLHGYWSISQPIAGNGMKLSAVQGNIEQARKWDPRYAKEIMQTYSELTLKASEDRPVLIIWPETATPGSISLDQHLDAEVKEAARRAKASLLLGSTQHQKFEGREAMEVRYFNSAYLIDPDPQIIENQRYDKIRLFPFGEYLPHRDIIPWSIINVYDSGNYKPGKEFTIFQIPPFRFGVTICWENVFPDLFRQFVKRGAQFMVNITNEARFGKTAAPYQLASISVFRAVENRVFVVRCANTGISCIIDPYGRMIDRIKDAKGQDIFIQGVLTGWIIPLDSRTIYSRYGDWFIWMAIAGSVLFLLIACFTRRRQTQGA
jgi:apolipoprotein N-acyltransferase